MYRDESDEIVHKPSDRSLADNIHPLVINVTEYTGTSPRADTVPIYTYHSSPGPIQSVYDAELEAKQRGLIKEMVFVAPVNHEV